MSGMIIHRPAAIVFAAALAAGVSGAAQASSVLVTPADYTGSRSFIFAGNGGIQGSGGAWTDNKDDSLSLSWEITENAGVFTYVYTLDLTAKKGDVSHFDIEVSESFTADNILPGTDTPVGFGDGAFDGPAAFNLIKFDFGSGEDDSTFSYTLVSDRVPVWGDFLAKGGAGAAGSAWNTGIGTDPTEATVDFTNWIPTPDTDTVTIIPTPAAMWGGLALLGGLGLARSKRRHDA